MAPPLITGPWPVSGHFEIASPCDGMYVLYNYLFIIFHILTTAYRCHMILDPETQETCGWRSRNLLASEVLLSHLCNQIITLLLH
jgi:hypothetical protein